MLIDLNLLQFTDHCRYCSLCHWSGSPSISLTVTGQDHRRYHSLSLVRITVDITHCHLHDDIIATVLRLPDNECSRLSSSTDCCSRLSCRLPSSLPTSRGCLNRICIQPPRWSHTDQYQVFSVLSKTLERIVARLLIKYWSVGRPPPWRAVFLPYSSFCEGDSAECASGVVDLAILTLVDMSAAFDTVDNVNCSPNLRYSTVSMFVSVTGSSHISVPVVDLVQSDHCGGTSYTATLLICGVLQGSFLWTYPLSSIYCDVLQLILNGLHRHFNSFVVCRNMKRSPVCRGTISLDDDDDAKKRYK